MLEGLIKGRKFQFWEYHVSHGAVLIRSPAGLDYDFSLDLIFIGVEYVAVPRHLGEISIASTSNEEFNMLKSILKKDIHPSRVWVLQGGGERYFIVASSLKIEKHFGDIFDSPF